MFSVPRVIANQRGRDSIGIAASPESDAPVLIRQPAPRHQRRGAGLVLHRSAVGRIIPDPQKQSASQRIRKRLDRDARCHSEGGARAEPCASHRRPCAERRICRMGARLRPLLSPVAPARPGRGVGSRRDSVRARPQEAWGRAGVGLSSTTVEDSSRKNGSDSGRPNVQSSAASGRAVVASVQMLGRSSAAVSSSAAAGANDIPRQMGQR